MKNINVAKLTEHALVHVPEIHKKNQKKTFFVYKPARG